MVRHERISADGCVFAQTMTIPSLWWPFAMQAIMIATTHIIERRRSNVRICISAAPDSCRRSSAIKSELLYSSRALYATRGGTLRR